MQLDATAAPTSPTTYTTSTPLVRRPGLLACVLRYYKVLAFCCAGHPPRASVFRNSFARVTFFVALMAVRIAFIGWTFIGDSPSLILGGKSTQLATSLYITTGIVHCVLIALSPLLLLREVAPASRVLRSPTKPRPSRNLMELALTQSVPSLEVAALLYLVVACILPSLVNTAWGLLGIPLLLMVVAGSWVVPLAAASACTACGDGVQRWFDTVVATQPAIINVDMDSPVGPRSALVAPTGGQPVSLEHWLDQQRFRYHELVRDVGVVASASTCTLLLALLAMLLEVCTQAVFLYSSAGSPATPLVLSNVLTYAVMATAATVILRSAARVHFVTLERCSTLDVSLHRVPLHAVQQVQTLILRRPVAFAIAGYPLTFSDFTRGIIALMGAALPAVARTIAA